jgi:hypothetical protein
MSRDEGEYQGQRMCLRKSEKIKGRETVLANLKQASYYLVTPSSQVGLGKVLVAMCIFDRMEWKEKANSKQGCQDSKPGSASLRQSTGLRLWSVIVITKGSPDIL